MPYKPMVPGDLFVVPLFAGGYAYGCATYVGDAGRGILCDIFDLRGDTPDPPSNIAEVPLLVRDMWNGKGHFFGEQGHPFRKMAWRQLPGRTVVPRLPRQRYAYLIKTTGKSLRSVTYRIDTHREEPPAPIRNEESRTLENASAFSSGPNATAWIEVRLLRLQVNWLDYADGWLESMDGRAPRAAAKPRRPRVKHKTAAPSAKPSTRGKYAPGRLIDAERSTLSMPIPADAIATFQAHEREGNGYDWTAVVRILVRRYEPGLGRQLRYDPEADTFAVSSKSKPALAKVAKLIRKAIANEKVLADAIAKSELD